VASTSALTWSKLT